MQRRHDMSVLRKMTDVIAYRGPDGEGHWSNTDQTVYLAHRRLSILDLSDCGAQPMHYLDRYTIVFNGEIYNYVELREELLAAGFTFRSHSDTEVILALYHQKKEQCLQQMDGMFAMAIHDRVDNTLFCARDRFGEKPFFYHYEQGRGFFFGSEMKALWAGGVPRSINNRMLFNYLTNGAVQNPQDSAETFFEQIVRLKPAHYIKLSVSNCTITEHKRYWSLENIQVKPVKDEEAIDTFRSLFLTSLQRRLRSDVPVGSSLSGGLDSSLIVMMIDKIKGDEQVQKTFSARFPGFSRDEGAYMEQVIERCRVEPHFTYPDDETMIRDIEDIFYHQEEPFGSASICAQFEVMRLAKQNGVTVLLDGQGADEILAGYHAYFPSFFRELKSTDPARYQSEKQQYETLHQGNNVNPVQKSDLRTIARQHPSLGWLRQAAKGAKRALQPELNKDFYGAYSGASLNAPAEFKTLNQHLGFAATGQGLEQLLRYADRNSMAFSLEVRLPYLSHLLVEYAFSLPSDMKIRGGWTKWLMRQAYTELLPQDIAWRKEKIGYEPPQQKWLSRPEIKKAVTERKAALVDQKILHPRTLQRDQEDGGRFWTYWMAGLLTAK